MGYSFKGDNYFNVFCFVLFFPYEEWSALNGKNLLPLKQEWNIFQKGLGVL